ncbi:coiled-coil domain-containing protein 17-like [Neoarius graeffei]|uniref:coiled-coil domain-containing protein 17-like n=1 Tax=Neoarius graeffei TaxID=443677 RepID=UPI00298D2F1F|nr:coiled-coil domain-containing protein 17-like [Neoarius graeffei]
MGSLICAKCNMTFRSMHFLVQHKEKFCIGAISQSETDHSDRTEDHHTEDLAEVHKCNTVLSDGHKQLDMQRQEIDYKLQELAVKTGKVAELERMLFELKEDEQRNTALLETLMDHLQQKGQDIHQSNDSNQHVANTEERVIEKYIPVYSCGVLSTEISTLHLSYLQRGGKDPQILAQLQHLLDAAIKLETQAEKTPVPKTNRESKYSYILIILDNRKHLSRELMSIELENRRLEEEIMKLELRKRTSRTTPNCQPAEQEMRAAKMDIDLLKHELEINRLRKQIMSRKTTPSIVTFPPLEEPGSPPLTKYLIKESDGLYPSPYDEMAGFVVFYDFLLGLCPSYRVCQLMVGIYSGDVCLGTPSILPPVYCDPVSSHEHSVGQKAILASKQAVPGVQPASSISLVMHVQASGGYDIYGHKVTHLAPRGWLKLHIFDHHNHVISGRWKVPVRLLPAKPSMTMAEINAVPQLDNAELYLRIVNTRDAEIQSSVPISITNAGIYQYPPVQTPRYPSVMQESRQESHEAVRSPAVQKAQVHASAFSQHPVDAAS